MPDATPFHDLATLDALDDALARAHDAPVVFFKHSATCPVSARAHDRMTAFAADADAPVYRIVVQTARPVSNALAERTGVRHESPQVLVVQGGAAVFDAAHGRVTAEAVRDALAHAAA
jgi:thioredoxin 1